MKLNTELLFMSHFYNLLFTHYPYCVTCVIGNNYLINQLIITIITVWGLRTNTLLQDLYLGHNKLTPEDAKLLGSLLITNRTIRLLDLRNNRLQVGYNCYRYTVDDIYLVKCVNCKYVVDMLLTIGHDIFREGFQI